MTARTHPTCTATPEAIARRVQHAQTMIEKVHPGQVTVTEDHPAKEDRDGSTMSHWRYLLDENGRQYSIRAMLFSPSNGEGDCRVSIEVGDGRTYAEVVLTLDQSKDFMLASALNAIAEVNEGGDLRGDQNPEPAPAPALPEGWRLADHEDHGRVIVTTPTPDDDGDLYFAFPFDDLTGYDWDACRPDELTFLDQGADQ